MASISTALGPALGVRRERPDRGPLDDVRVRELASDTLMALFKRRMITKAATRTAMRIATAPAMIPPI